MFYDDDGRRYGDWLHRQQRTRESANEIVKDSNEQSKKWYQENFWIIFFLVVFWPVGIYIMWRNAPWPLAVKIIVSIIVAFMVFVAFNMSMVVNSLNMG